MSGAESAVEAARENLTGLPRECLAGLPSRSSERNNEQCIQPVFVLPHSVAAVFALRSAPSEDWRCLLTKVRTFFEENPVV
jgi:hypothetical protein